MLHAIHLPEAAGSPAGGASDRDEVLDRVERLHLHLTALGHATSSDDVADILVTAAREVTRGDCARATFADTSAAVRCGRTACGVCTDAPGPVAASAGRQTWRLREGQLVVAVEVLDDVAARLVAWLVEQASLSLDRTRRSRSAAATVDALLRSERERSELVEVLAHDLRSPMTALHGFASLLTTRWGDLDEDRRRDLLGMIQKETERMNRMVEDVSTAVLGPTTSLPVRIDRVDLGAVATSLVVAAQAARPSHSIRCVVVPGAPEAHADPDGVARILGNLLENATRHTPQGTVVLVHVGRDEHAVTITVADDGPGVAEADTARIFERGVRGAEPLGPGSGLGLHTARSLAEDMGGTLELAPSARGATFVLRLPLASLRGI